MRILAVFATVLALNACAASHTPAGRSGTAKPDTTKVPLTDLGTGTCGGLQGGLYPNGSNAMPSARAALGTLVRTPKVRYPNLQVVFLSSRIYAGYAQPATLNPEPFAYETGFAVKWLIEAQIRQGTSGAPDVLAGDLRPGVAAPWLPWGPYLWANGTTPRSDGLTWVQSDFTSDNTPPNTGARQQAGALLLGFMKNSPHASCWFLS